MKSYKDDIIVIRARIIRARIAIIKVVKVRIAGVRNGIIIEIIKD